MALLLPSMATASCPNDAFRVGASANLPDCRAYELVTPSDSDGRTVGDILLGGIGDMFPTELSSPFRDSFIFSTGVSPLATPGEAMGVFDVYETVRTASEWKLIRRLTPAGKEIVLPIIGGSSADHGFVFIHVGPVTNEAGEDFGSLWHLYGGDADLLGGPEGDFELTGVGGLGSERLAEGRYISPDGEHIIFTTGKDREQSRWCAIAVSKFRPCSVKQLEPDAPPSGTGAVYDRTADGPTQVVSLLPGNVTPGAGQEAFYQGASVDGTVVAFKVDGTLYIRVGNQVTKKVTEDAAAFGGFSADGRFLFYVSDGNIHRFDTETENDLEVNSTGEGQLVNVSPDGSRLYFISGEDLTGAQQNSEGSAAVPPAEGSGSTLSGSTTVTSVSTSSGNLLPGMTIKGVGIPPDTEIVAVGSDTVTLSKPALESGIKSFTASAPNLYLWDEGSVVYVGTLVASDIPILRWTASVSPESGSGPGLDHSRTSHDGSAFVFESRAPLTSYDNVEATEGSCGSPVLANEHCREIYRYDDGDNTLLCISCPSGGDPASADARLQDPVVTNPQTVIRNLTEDGSRIFFETRQGLTDGDHNAFNDIYEWQEPGGIPELSLISSGGPLGYTEARITRPNVLLGIKPDGSEVFFRSLDTLVPGAGEGGVPAIYDARVGGGFASAAIPSACGEDSCRPAPNPSKPPAVSPPASAGLHGAGNVRFAKKKKRQKRHHKKHRRCHRRRGEGCTKKSARLSASGSGLHQTRVVGGGAAAVTGITPQPPQSFEDPRLAVAPGEEFTAYGLKSVGAAVSTTAAAGHPDLTASFTLNPTLGPGEEALLSAKTEKIVVNLPPGFSGNPNLTPRCSSGQFLAEGCPFDSQVGVSLITLVSHRGPVAFPLYSLALPHPGREIARFGVIIAENPAYIDIFVRTASDYGITATVRNAPGGEPIEASDTVIWGDPSDPSHDKLRMTSKEAAECNGTACKAPGGERSSGLPPIAFLTNPSACQSQEVGFSVTSYQLPGKVFSKSAPLASTTSCQSLPFSPGFEAKPTNAVAGAPTGLKTSLHLPQKFDPAALGTATMREARVTLPEGMQIAAGAANWIGTCSAEQVGFHEEVDTACPDASKLGTATIISPALPVPIEGAVYQQTPAPGHPFGLWLAADALGLHIKIPGELEPDKQTGRLTAVFRDLPQVPVEEIDLNVWGGDRAPLQNPGRCGTYTTDFSFAPHSNDPAVTGQSQMKIDEGCDQGFDPKISVGVSDPVAGKFSPFSFDLIREDGQQALRGFELHLPDGESAKLKGVPLCPDADAAAGSCPAASRIGHLSATSGPGPEPLSLPQPGKAEPQIFLAGPYQGAPFSIVSEVPAQAGPFDLGILAVRNGLDVDPETARATVDADPLPQFFEGVGIDYRHLHAVIDRPNFSLNPTDCREMAVTSDVTSTQGTVAHPATRFQVDGCKALKFKPKLTLKLRGGTKRTDYPALTAVLKARKGDANIARTSVALPHSEFLAQEHIGTICTRKQFAADKCPKRSIYGKAKAWTPLLDKPLEGPVYLRSSDNPLPDMVVALGGELDLALVSRIDSFHGGLRATFEQVPDAPVTKFVMQMKGGNKGLFVNSTDICRGTHRATVEMRAQNGRALSLRPELKSAGCGSSKHSKRHQGKSR